MEEKNQPRRPRRAPEEQTRNESLVYGKNPVTELLKSGSGVDTVLISESMAPAVAAYYTALAKEAGAAVKRVNPNKLRLMTGTESHQGVAAFASEIAYATVEDLLAAAKAKGVKFGRPPIPLPDNFYPVHKAWRAKKLTLKQTTAACGMPVGTFYSKAVKFENTT